MGATTRQPARPPHWAPLSPQMVCFEQRSECSWEDSRLNASALNHVFRAFQARARHPATPEVRHTQRPPECQASVTTAAVLVRSPDFASVLEGASKRLAAEFLRYPCDGCSKRNGAHGSEEISQDKKREAVFNARTLVVTCWMLFLATPSALLCFVQEHDFSPCLKKSRRRRGCGEHSESSLGV